MGKLALSSRAEVMQESSIRKLAPYAVQAKKEGVHVFHLNIGQPDIHTPEEMLDAYRNPPAVVEYGPSDGIYTYREKLAEYYKRKNIPAAPEDIFITTGGSEAIIFALMAAVSPGDEIIIPEPFYTNYNGFAAMAGAVVVPVTTRIEDGFHLPSVKEFEKVLTPKTRAICFSNPGNPTGAVFTRDELGEIADFARRKNLYIISDEVYREFTYDGRHAVSILEFEGLEENAILIDSVSKRYSACGARVGNIVTRNRNLLGLVLRFGQARLCPPTVDQMAAEAATATPDSYFQEVVAEYTKRRDLAWRELSSIPGVEVPKPEGAFYMVVQLPVKDAEKFAVWLLKDFRQDGATTMVAPAEGFYGTPGLGRNQVRLAYVLNEKDLEKAIAVIREGLKAYPG